jgi:hypothetical protein
MSPPEERGGAGSGSQRTPAPDNNNNTYCPSKSSSTDDTAWRRRNTAAVRLQPLESGVRDPWRRSEMSEMSEHQLHAWRQTVLHLWEHGLPARFPADVQAALDAYVHRCAR